MSQNYQKETNDYNAKTLYQLSKTKPDIVKQFLTNHSDKISLAQLLVQLEELEKCIKLNAKLKQEFNVLEKLIDMAVEN